MNNTLHSVRQSARGVSLGSIEDRRVRRTQQALSFALITLVLEKGYDAITIQNLLDRADVGRSTFYSHYRGKEDLLLRSFARLLESLDRNMAQDDSVNPRLAPVRELFRHVEEMQSFIQALGRARMLDRLYQIGTNQVSRTIADRLATRPFESGRLIVPLPVIANAAAGALFALLKWWVDNDAPYSPERMDVMYHAIRPSTKERVIPTLPQLS
jgi:AcrR family transcriptional regulator